MISLPGHDPDVASWLVAVVELAAAVAALAATRTVDRGDKRARSFWWAVGLLMLVFAVNKQLDLQVFAIAEARALATDHSLKLFRHVAPPLVVLAVCVVAAGMLVYLGWAAASFTRFRIAMVGVALILVFALLRTLDITGENLVPRLPGHEALLPLEGVAALIVLVAALRQRGIGAPAPGVPSMGPRSRRVDPPRR